MFYKSLGRLIEMNNKIKMEKTEGEEALKYVAIPDSSLVVKSLTGVELDMVVTTGAVDNTWLHW